MSRAIAAANIRLIMSIRGISQEALGSLLGTTQGYVWQLLSPPHKRLSRAAIGRVAAALGVPVEWMSDPALAGKTVEELRGDGTPAALDGDNTQQNL